MKKSNIIPFPAKAVRPSLAEIDYSYEAMSADERASKLAVLTGFLGARDGMTEVEVLRMMLVELGARNPFVTDHSDTLERAKTGFSVWQNNPELSGLEVFNMQM